MWAEKLYYTTLKSVLPTLMRGSVFGRAESTSCSVSLTGSWRRNGDLRVVPATCKGFLEMFTQI